MYVARTRTRHDTTRNPARHTTTAHSDTRVCVFASRATGNPSAEQQAIDRAHRLGQERPVTVIRFIIRDSIEERILDLQDKKRKIAQGAFAGGASDVGQQSRGLALSELRQLFEP